MADAYLTPVDAQARLSALGYEAQPTEGELRIASAIIDGHRPFHGTRAAEQERQFPRNDDTVVPDDVLDAVVLTAYADSTDEANVPVKSESVGDVAITYSTPSISKVRGHAYSLLRPYMRMGGAL